MIEPSVKTGRAGAAPPWLRVLLPIGVAATAFLTFWPALDNEFVNWDDDKLLLECYDWRGLDLPHLQWMFTAGRLGHYQPLTWLSYAIDLRLWGDLDPRGFHLTSMVFHAFNAVLLYALALRLLRMATDRPGTDSRAGHHLGAALAALLFAAHPLRAESVAWVTERRDVLSAFFLVPCVYCYLRYATARRWAGRWYAASLTLLLLSLMSKAWGITAPALLLVLDFYPLRRLRWGWSHLRSRQALAAYLDKLPIAALAGWAAYVAARAQSFGDVMKSVETYSLPNRIAQALYGLTFYIGKTLVPASLAPIYEIPEDMNPLAGRFVAAAAAVIALTALLVLVRKRFPAGLTSWVIYGIVLSPVLGLTQSGPQLVADRYSYIACMPWALLAGAALARCWPTGEPAARRGRRALLAAGVAVALVAGLAAMTWRQALVWRSSWSLWEHALAVNPDSWNAHNNLAALYEARGDDEQALRHFRAVLAVKDDLAAGWSNVGVILARQGQEEEALQHVRQARTLASNDDAVLKQVAGVLLRLGQLRESLETYEQVLRLAPGDPQVHAGLAAALWRLDRGGEAIPHLEQAVQLMEDYARQEGRLAGRASYAPLYKRVCSDLADLHQSRGNHTRARLYAQKLRVAGE